MEIIEVNGRDLNCKIHISLFSLHLSQCISLSLLLKYMLSKIHISWSQRISEAHLFLHQLIYLFHYFSYTLTYVLCKYVFIYFCKILVISGFASSLEGFRIYGLHIVVAIKLDMTKLYLDITFS